MLAARVLQRSLRVGLSGRCGRALMSSNAGKGTTGTVPASRKPKVDAPVEGADEELSVEYNFDEEIEKIMTKVYEEAMTMREQNDHFEVDFYPEHPSLTIFTQRGKLAFYKDEPRSMLVYSSFNSGNHNYYFNPIEGRWLGEKDDHDIRGVIIRDLIKHNKGMPDLE